MSLGTVLKLIARLRDRVLVKSSIFEEDKLGHETLRAPRYGVQNATFKTARQFVENWMRYRSCIGAHLN